MRKEEVLQGEPGKPK